MATVSLFQHLEFAIADKFELWSQKFQVQLQ